MPPSSRTPSRTGARPAGPLRSHSGLRYARTRAGSVLVIDVDDLGAVRGRGPHTELGLSLLRCPADETRQARRPPSGSSDPRCCDEKGVTACAGRSDARIARIPHRPTGRSASTARVGAGMRAGNGADLVDLEQPPGSISPRGGHERLGTFLQLVTLVRRTTRARRWRARQRAFAPRPRCGKPLLPTRTFTSCWPRSEADAALTLVESPRNQSNRSGRTK